MPRWSGRSVGFLKNTWKAPATAAKDAVAAAEGSQTTPALTAMWTAGQAVADTLMDTLSSLPNLGGGRTFDVEVIVAEDAKFVSINVAVSYRS